MELFNIGNNNKLFNFKGLCLRFNFLFFIFFSFLLARIDPLDFEVITKNGEKSGPTLLLIGGIQGDEPGGFNATNIFLTHYKLTKGNALVVPVLNPHSMLLNHRGIYDDMNRKFADLSKKDPEFELVNHIKEVIKKDEVDIILHLHDGSGFWRPVWHDAKLNPNRWGNCTAIDQEVVPDIKYGDLLSIATSMTENVNKNLINPLHKYHINNTKTIEKNDVEMKKALTLYAILNKKSAIANEASKELPLNERVYYHLLALEGLLNHIGIEFSRDFELTPNGVKEAINDKNFRFSIEGMKDLPFNLRQNLGVLPLENGKNYKNIKLDSSVKILGILPNKDGSSSIKYGNTTLTRFTPKFYELDSGLNNIEVALDSNNFKKVAINSQITLNESAKFKLDENYTAKVIGKNGEFSGEFDVLYNSLDPLRSMDKAGNLYRVEFYKNEVLDSPKTEPKKDNKAIVIVNAAYVRSEPNIESSPLALAPFGREVEIQENLNDWVRIKYDFKGREISGFMASYLLEVKQKAFIKPRIANVRSNASLDSSVIDFLNNGAMVNVLEYGDVWSKVVFSKNSQVKSGFIYSTLLDSGIKKPESKKLFSGFLILNFEPKK